MYKGILTSLDGNKITERSNVSCKVQFNRLPNHGDYVPFIYIDEDCESPGVVIGTDNVEKTEQGYIFEDIEGRKFSLEIKE